jgi:hypothetical protein
MSIGDACPRCDGTGTEWDVLELGAESECPFFDVRLRLQCVDGTLRTF